MTQKAAFERMKNLDAKEVVSAMKIIDLDAEISAEKAMVPLIFEIDGGGIYMAMALMNQDTTILFQIIVLVSKIRCLKTIIFPLVSCLVDIVTKEQYL